MAHLAVEKTLKAVVAEITGAVPPKTHNLIRLLDLTGIEMPHELRLILGELNATAGIIRYPEDLNSLIAAYPGPVASQYLKRAQKVIKWLQKSEPLKK